MNVKLATGDRFPRHMRCERPSIARENNAGGSSSDFVRVSKNVTEKTSSLELMTLQKYTEDQKILKFHPHCILVMHELEGPD
jgi:hypothetical protein